MSAARRIYRATAHYAATPGGQPGNTITRHFQTRRARDAWADRRREGYDEQPGTFREYDDGRPAIPPATAIDTADSNPVTWPSLEATS